LFLGDQLGSPPGASREVVVERLDLLHEREHLVLELTLPTAQGLEVVLEAL
jgi:hypothetical protein